MTSERAPGPLGLPPDPSRPFFAYGSLRPGGLAYRQIEAFVESSAKEEINGQLHIRDGLPLLTLGEGRGCAGHILNFKSGSNREAYEVVCKFEPKEHYRWGTFGSTGFEVNVLLARSPNQGGVEALEESEWTIEMDTMLSHGLDDVGYVLQDALDLRRIPLERQPFRLQMAYLLLWSILERLSAFAVSAAAGPTARSYGLATVPEFASAMSAVVEREDVVSAADDPTKKFRLTPRDPHSSIRYYYQVRSNATHRGKAAMRDSARLQWAALELYAITARFLRRREVLDCSEALKRL